MMTANAFTYHFQVHPISMLALDEHHFQMFFELIETFAIFICFILSLFDTSVSRFIHMILFQLKTEQLKKIFILIRLNANSIKRFSIFFFQK